MLRVVVLGAAAGGGVPQWNCGCPVCRAARNEHPELESTQASIAFSADGAALVSRQRLSRPAPATDRDAAVASQGGRAAPQPDRGRDPDQRRDRRGRGTSIDARGLALCDLCPRQGAGDPEVQQHLQRAEREERGPPADRDRPCLRARSARRLALRHRSDAFTVPGKGAWYLEGKAHPGGATGPATRSAFALRTRPRTDISTSSPPAPTSPTS